jgi:hypothetical protein
MTKAHLSPTMKLKIPATRRGGRVFEVARGSAGWSLLSVALMLFLLGGSLNAAPSDPWTRGTGLFSNTILFSSNSDPTLGALRAPGLVNRQWPDLIDYDVDLNSWRYDVYVPAGYDGTKPYGVVVYTSSDATGVVLQTAATDKNLDRAA